MLETHAVVVQVNGQGAKVQAGHGDGCGQCSGKGCGAGKLSQLFCSNPRIFQVDNPIKACVGDEVVVLIADGAILRGISLVYILPLLMLFMGAALGNNLAEQLGQRDGYAAIGALCGLVVGFVIAGWISSLQGSGYSKAYISKKWSEDKDCLSQE